MSRVWIKLYFGKRPLVRNYSRLFLLWHFYIFRSRKIPHTYSWPTKLFSFLALSKFVLLNLISFSKDCGFQIRYTTFEMDRVVKYYENIFRNWNKRTATSFHLRTPPKFLIEPGDLEVNKTSPRVPLDYSAYFQ